MNKRNALQALYIMVMIGIAARLLNALHVNRVESTVEIHRNIAFIFAFGLPILFGMGQAWSSDDTLRVSLPRMLQAVVISLPLSVLLISAIGHGSSWEQAASAGSYMFVLWFLVPGFLLNLKKSPGGFTIALLAVTTLLAACGATSVTATGGSATAVCGGGHSVTSVGSSQTVTGRGATASAQGGQASCGP